MYQNYSNYFNPLFALISGSLIIFGFLFLGLGILYLIAKWKVYQKAGKFGWEALIPFYSTWILVEISGLKWWFFFIAAASGLSIVLGLGLLFPLGNIVSLIGLFFCHYNLAIKFGKEPISYGIGLTILPIIFYPILAFSLENKYNHDASVSSYGPIKEEKVNDYYNNRKNYNPNSKSNNKINFCRNCGNKVGKDKFCSSCGKEIK